MTSIDILAEALYENNNIISVNNLMTMLLLADIDEHVMNQAIGVYEDYRIPGLLTLLDGHLGDLDEHTRIIMEDLE